MKNKNSSLKYRKRFKYVKLNKDYFEKSFVVYPADDFRLSFGFSSHCFYHVKVSVLPFKPF